MQIGLYDRQFDDFVDLNAGEKTIMKLWNAHMCRFPVLGNNMLQIELDRFVDAHAAVIVGMNLYKNFLLHLTNLVEFGVLDQGGLFVELSLTRTLKCPLNSIFGGLGFTDSTTCFGIYNT